MEPRSLLEGHFKAPVRLVELKIALVPGFEGPPWSSPGWIHILSTLELF